MNIIERAMAIATAISSNVNMLVELSACVHLAVSSLLESILIVNVGSSCTMEPVHPSNSWSPSVVGLMLAWVVVFATYQPVPEGLPYCELTWR